MMASQRVGAGEGNRTLDIQLGKRCVCAKARLNPLLLIAEVPVNINRCLAAG
jgi:hypothetical protein